MRPRLFSRKERTKSSSARHAAEATRFWRLMLEPVEQHRFLTPTYLAAIGGALFHNLPGAVQELLTPCFLASRLPPAVHLGAYNRWPMAAPRRQSRWQPAIRTCPEVSSYPIASGAYIRVACVYPQ
jgi:hypothetical protein